MLARGIDPTPEELARVGRLTLARARAWFALTEADMPARELGPVCKNLHIRMIWLVSGDSVPQSRCTMTPQDAEALSALLALPEDRRDVWLGMGRWMASATRDELPW